MLPFQRRLRLGVRLYCSAVKKREVVMVMNCGSSSIKYQLLDMANSEQCVLKGHVDGIGAKSCKLIQTDASGDKEVTAIPEAGYDDSMQRVFDSVAKLRDVEVTVVGHRVVHGGMNFTAATLATDAALEQIRECVPLAPLHNPANIRGIEMARKCLGSGVPQVVSFDTAFHHTLPPYASLYAIPYETAVELKIKRYGFHGLSHQYVSEAAAALLGLPYDRATLIIAHLGSGCSATSVRHGKSMDTTMGMTPLDGLIMGTRAGQLDPGIEEYMCNQMGVGIDEVTRLLNRKSGLLGVSGISADMRELVAYAQGQVESATAEQVSRANLAIDMFVYRLCRHIAALMVASMSSCDALVFTGGIGEGSSFIRNRVMQKLKFLGIFENQASNAVHGTNNKRRLISEPDSPMLAMVVPTNEELQIAREAVKVLEMA
ncbi:Acetate kinase [Diplonema papillatum]|nr:Acetate kinase [Diplonema papillatum]